MKTHKEKVIFLNTIAENAISRMTENITFEQYEEANFNKLESYEQDYKHRINNLEYALNSCLKMLDQAQYYQRKPEELIKKYKNLLDNKI